MNFICKVCDQCYKGVAAFRIHSLDVHSIEDPELGKLLRCLSLIVHVMKKNKYNMYIIL